MKFETRDKSNSISIRNVEIFKIIIFNSWFNIMTNRSRIFALSKSNIKMYNDVIAHLRKTQQIFRSMLIGKKGHWKPVLE